MSCHHQCNRRIMDKQRYMDQCLIQTLLADVVTGVDVVAAVDVVIANHLVVSADVVIANHLVALDHIVVKAF